MQTRRTTAAALSALLLMAPHPVSGQESQAQGGAGGKASEEDKEWAKGWDVVTGYDEPPKVAKIEKPNYPRAAFELKIEGTVVLQILVDATGRVPLARVLQSVPGLDAAAIQCVKTWKFKPAQKDGRPVATLARAPIGFRIFGSPATAARVGPIRFDPLGADLSAWIERLLAEIHGHWSVPKVPVSDQGSHVDVEFVVERDGAVADVRILKSSGTRTFDKAASDALRHSRLLSLPADYPEPRMRIQISFSFDEGAAPAAGTR